MKLKIIIGSDWRECKPFLSILCIICISYARGCPLIRFKIKELIAKKEFAEGRRITNGEVANAAGIHRMTLSKLINQRGYNTSTDNLNRLCAYFDCRVEELVEYVPDESERDE